MANLALKHYGEGFNGSMTSKGHGLYSQKQIALQFSYSIHLPLPVWSRFMGKDQLIRKAARPMNGAVTVTAPIPSKRAL
jgi:hypothetical protein